MYRIKSDKKTRFIISTLVTVVILSSVLSFPTSVQAISVTQSTPQNSYLLGASVSLPADINFIPSDEAPIKQVTLNIQGPQPLNVNLPFTPGPFSITTANSGTVSGTVSWDNVGYTGYGYGYGSNPSATSRIRYNPLTWKTPLVLNPPPPPVGPALPGWQGLYNTPGNQFPKGLGYDSANNRLYVAVDDFPTDRILILNADTGALLKSFNAPEGMIEAADFMVGGAMPGLYLAGQQSDFSAPNGKIYHYTTTALSNYISGASPSIGPPHHSFPVPFQVGGLANDGTNLLAGAAFMSQLAKLDPTNGNQVGPLFFLNSPPGPCPPCIGGGPLPGAHALAFFGTNNQLLWSTGNMIARIDMNGPNPSVLGFENLNPMLMVEGMSIVGNYVYMAGNDPMNPGLNKIYKAWYPGAPTPDPTAAGSYTAQISVTGSLLAQGPQVNFSLTKISQVNVTITSPADGSAVQSTSVNVTGTVNDPSIPFVTVGATIGAQEYIRDKVETVVVPAGQTTTGIWQAGGMWHVSEDRSLQLPSQTATIQQPGQKSWAYNKPPQFGGPPNYDNGAANSGFLETKNSYSVGGASKLAFWNGWNTEPPTMFDKKTIEAFVDGSWQPVAQIVEAGFFGGPPPMFGPPPGFGGPALMVWGVDTTEVVVDASSGFVQVQVPQFTWKQVVLDFKNRFANKNIKLRFKFDTVDQYANFMEGWYIDNIVFKAESALGGQQAVVGPNLNWSTTVTIGEGANPITVVGVSGYSAALGGPPQLTGTDTNTVYLDTTAPAVTIDAVTSPTSSATQTVTGTVVDSNLDTVTMSQVSDAGTKPYTLTLTTVNSTTKTFSQSVNLVAGTNTITVTATDKATLTGTATATIVYDIVPPTITAGATLYPVGEVSARTGDFFVFQVEASDFGIGVTAVQLLMPFGGQGPPPGVVDNTTEQTGSDGDKYQKISGAWYKLLSFKKATNVPQAVRTQWGVSGDVTNRWLMPMHLPSSAPPGTYSLTARAKDGGGNTATATVTAQVVSTLSKFNISLMPDWNLISTPLIPNNTSMSTVMAGLQAQGLQSVWYYNTATNTWSSYDPTSQANSLTTFETGKGYWAKMDTTAFSFDAPLAAGLPNTPRPVKLTVSGQMLQAGNQPPPTYAIKAGWNLVGLHNERDTAVSNSLAGLTSPFGAKLWASLLEYKNFIKYPTQQGEQPETVLGAFASVGPTGTMNPGKGYWLFASSDGTIVP